MFFFDLKVAYKNNNVFCKTFAITCVDVLGLVTDSRNLGQILFRYGCGEARRQQYLLLTQHAQWSHYNNQISSLRHMRQIVLFLVSKYYYRHRIYYTPYASSHNKHFYYDLNHKNFSTRCHCNSDNNPIKNVVNIHFDGFSEEFRLGNIWLSFARLCAMCKEHI